MFVKPLYLNDEDDTIIMNHKEWKVLDSKWHAPEVKYLLRRVDAGEETNNVILTVTVGTYIQVKPRIVQVDSDITEFTR